MKITKIGHCCLIIEEQGVRILTDPGNYSTGQNSVKNIDIILVTHEHGDHLHLDSLNAVLANNPQAKIVTNKGVGQILTEKKIPYETVGDKQVITIKNIVIEGYGNKHAEIYNEWSLPENTGYFINNKLFYPGDALYKPPKPVDVLALPVAGPWIKISESITYAKDVFPHSAFPVHDGNLVSKGVAHRLPDAILNPLGIKFVVLKEGETAEF